MNNKKTVILILSTMRSGSTLLKALLGNAKDVSHLSEINFQKFKFIEESFPLATQNIIVLKKPAWFNDMKVYPKIPKSKNNDIKKIILFREPYDNVISLKKLPPGFFLNFLNKFDLTNKFLLNVYWYKTYKKLLIYQKDDNVIYVSYEKLTKEPKKITKELYSFIGSTEKKGTQTYSKPNKDWKWGTDDGSEIIRKMKVQNITKTKNNVKLLNLISKNRKVNNLVKKYKEICL
ncbi:MAG: sulfotransferase domain-containing protein [Desulfobacterales bacterium]|nr:sulfotransferase domain-containing protein [Desulfobacterales bacterium]